MVSLGNRTFFFSGFKYLLHNINFFRGCCFSLGLGGLYFGGVVVGEHTANLLLLLLLML